MAACATARPDYWPAPDHIASRQTVTGISTGINAGTPVFAGIRTARGNEGGYVPEGPVAPFLLTYRGRMVTAEVALASVGFTSFNMILNVRIDGLTAEAWWQGLSERERRRVQCRVRAAMRWALPC